MEWLASVAVLTLGLVFLARDAEATEFLRGFIKRRAIIGRNTPKRNRISRFFDSWLQCAPCVAAWGAVVACALVWAIQNTHEIAAGVLTLLVACPIGGVGLLYGLTLLSPTQAAAVIRRMMVRTDGKAQGRGDAASKPGADSTAR